MKAISYMSEHLSDTVRTEDLATLCFMQPTYFVKRFHDAIGISPHSYFNRMRIYTAMGFLAGTDLSIEEISRKVGFSDTSYFTRIFKKYSNVTPSAYRKEFTVN